MGGSASKNAKVSSTAAGVGAAGAAGCLLGGGIAALAGATTVTMVLVGGGIFLGVAAGVGYLVYRYYKGKVDVHKEPAKELSEQNIKEIANFKIPSWSKLELTDEDLKVVREITLEQLKIKINEYTCPIGKFVTREPAKVTCCGKYFQQVAIRAAFQLWKRCPLCKTALTEGMIQPDLFVRTDAILYMRQQIRKAYRELTTAEQKKKWAEVIKGGMGDDYQI